jgi:hypothetical protein
MVEIEDNLGDEKSYSIGIFGNAGGFAAVLLERKIKLVPRADRLRAAVMRRDEFVEVPVFIPLHHVKYDRAKFGFIEIGQSIETLVGMCGSVPTAYMNDLQVLVEFMENQGFNMTLKSVEVDPDNLLLKINAMTKDRSLVYKSSEKGSVLEAIQAEIKGMSKDEKWENHLLNALGLSLTDHQTGDAMWLAALSQMEREELGT